MPPSGHHPKKPLSKQQLKKRQEAYARADDISHHVQELEKREKEEAPPQQEIKDHLDQIFL